MDFIQWTEEKKVFGPGLSMSWVFFFLLLFESCPETIRQMRKRIQLQRDIRLDEVGKERRTEVDHVGECVVVPLQGLNTLKASEFIWRTRIQKGNSANISSWKTLDSSTFLIRTRYDQSNHTESGGQLQVILMLQYICYWQQ